MTGPEFATAHGNDSSAWTSADFETEMNLAEADCQPAWILLRPKPDTHQHTPAA